MIIENFSQPELITLEGDANDISYRLRDIMDSDDYSALMGSDYVTLEDIDYLNRKYPELMGGWIKVIGKIGKGIGKGVGKLFRVIGRRRRARRAKKNAAAQAAAKKRKLALLRKRQQLIAMQQQEQVEIDRKENMKKVVLVGVVAAAVIYMVQK